MSRTCVCLVMLAACGRTALERAAGDAPMLIEGDAAALCIDLGGGLLLWYRFEAAEPMADSSGNDVTATCDTCPSATAGALGDGIELSGTEYVRVAPSDPALLQTVDGFSLAAYVRVNRLPMSPDGSIVSKQRGTASAVSYWMGIYGTSVEVWVEESARIVEPVAFGVGDIAHIAVTWEPDRQLLLYQNGALSGGASGVAPGFDDHDVTIGTWEHSDPPTRTEFWDGLIDEVRIYDRALSSAEIAALARCNR